MRETREERARRIMTILLEARDIAFARNGRTILESVAIAIKSNEVITLIGPNGSGKTTLLRILLGLQRPDAGRVHKKPGITIGYVPQKISITPTLQLRTEYFLQLPRRFPRRQVLAALAETGVEHLAKAELQGLSGGEFQRVLLARALLGHPDILVLDEPAQGIDFNGQLDLYQLIERVRRERGCGVLLVSHDLHLVMGATDKVICLNRHVCCSGAPASVSRHPEYLALFGPRAAQALAIYHHHHDHRHDIAGEAVPIDRQNGHAPSGSDC